MTDSLYFLPLGGSDEIGMNLNLYGYGPEGKQKWIIVDCGVTFGDLTTPGVDLIMPDPRFIEERRDDLIGMVLTHAHEDHMGAVAHLWRRLRCPIWATPFTAWLVRDRLREYGLLDEVELHEMALDCRFDLGPFNLQLVTLTHSIPEPNGIAIRTPAGMVLHTGDWKIDPAPMIGEATDIDALTAIGNEGVLAMVCDSTNVFSPGESGSEGDVREELIKVVGECKTGKVAIASFASNVARLQSSIEAAEANGRRVCLVGRSMHRMTAAAKAVGMLKHVKDFVSEEEASSFPASKILYLCTGSQGEPRAALSRIAAGNHRNVSLSRDDTVIFSSRVIPGNELGIFELQNQLAERGVHIITEKTRPIHVSGHPCRDELAQMYAWAKPSVAIPVHGERRHLLEHADFARELQVPHSVSVRNGDMVQIRSDGTASIVDEAPASRLHVDGNFIVDADAASMRERRKLAHAGQVTLSMAVSEKGEIVSGPEVRLQGVPEDDNMSLDDFADAMADEAERAFDRLSKRDRRDVERAEEEVRRAVRREANRIWGKKPWVEIMMLEV
ncbi:MAG: ribonuclease J [Maricaulis maris]|uniref:Beta-lactamase domain protein n=2 Tax=Maricaulaceae TaxID=2800061 RepID=Q0APX4_MARMM|nr:MULTISPECIES: ribonuclease J [Maricaulis]ABI65663.1 beta-lactamase domain protein [Maricaulis maris MCS10]MAC90621.1 MBL fold metallo-hydrolase [Maricaulis sp.]